MATETKEIQLPPIIEHHFDFCVWLVRKVSKFPKDQRFILGGRIENLTVGILEQLIEAALQRAGEYKLNLLRKINVALEQLRFLLRLACKLNVLNIRSLHYAVKLLVKIGNMLGAWIKSIPTSSAACGSSF